MELPVVMGIGRKEFLCGRLIGDPFLEAAFGEGGERETCDFPDATADDVSFESVQAFVVPVGQFDEGNSFCDFDDIGECIGTETAEPELPYRCVAPDVSATLSTGIVQGMFDGIHPQPS